MIVTPVRQPPLGEQLLDQLRALIVRGELAEGTHLVEGWMAERFGVSRGPVRDALKQLEIEGLVETRKRGVSVRGLTDTDIVELYAVRGALETLAVREVIARAAEADWAPLDDAVAVMREAAAAADPVRFGAADLDFHSGFYAIAANRRLASTWALHRPLFAAMLAVTNTDRDLAPVAQDHADLSAVVRSGEVEPALAALAVHLDGSCSRMRAFMATRSAA
ncbi:MAG: GntR family transcriptional regulator [Pseudonocardia sp.]|uniref:GntR family transcriptional regulator n=1 Tax=Pseudonocardia sp. TaxID=60912 RepID=UPI001AC75279|nr:GntR family transcriptional regulator [Pseudonocardia sp.]MBN9101726.1 GntR family transcriptional regulator [Pseudonocardia sp.]